MKNIRWGIAGAGGIANKFAKAVKNVDGATLAAVASRSEERGRAFGEKYGIENIFTSYEEMAKSDTVDAVYVATAHPFHKSCAEIFLNAKNPFYVKSPSA
ncbi:MAG: Gfo/Idh/MocA family oxidoreductase [Clostridia bacterium]|nr:Gfo/Idh/MocA family oxidoreductase [Clostridia bacterium]